MRRYSRRGRVVNGRNREDLSGSKFVGLLVLLLIAFAAAVVAVMVLARSVGESARESVDRLTSGDVCDLEGAVCDTKRPQLTVSVTPPKAPAFNGGMGDPGVFTGAW